MHHNDNSNDNNNDNDNDSTFIVLYIHTYTIQNKTHKEQELPEVSEPEHTFHGKMFKNVVIGFF